MLFDIVRRLADFCSGGELFSGDFLAFSTESLRRPTCVSTSVAMDAHTCRPAVDRLTSRDVRIWVASDPAPKPLDNAVLAADDECAQQKVSRPPVVTHTGISCCLHFASMHRI